MLHPSTAIAVILLLLKSKFIFKNIPYCSIAALMNKILSENVGHWADNLTKTKQNKSAQWLPKLCMVFPIKSFFIDLASHPEWFNVSFDSNHILKVIQGSCLVFLWFLNLSTFVSFNSQRRWFPSSDWSCLCMPWALQDGGLVVGALPLHLFLFKGYSFLFICWKMWIFMSDQFLRVLCSKNYSLVR